MKSGRQDVNASEVLPSSLKTSREFASYPSDHLMIRGKGIISFNLMGGENRERIPDKAGFEFEPDQDDLISTYALGTRGPKDIPSSVHEYAWSRLKYHYEKNNKADQELGQIP